MLVWWKGLIKLMISLKNHIEQDNLHIYFNLLKLLIFLTFSFVALLSELALTLINPCIYSAYRNTWNCRMICTFAPSHMSLVIRKPAFCICENKDADQLRSNCAAHQRLCFRYTDSTISLLP